MTSAQLVGLVVNIGIYAALIGFVLYRQMSRLPLNPRRLVLLPAIIAIFALQQLTRQPPAFEIGVVAFLALSLAVGILAGIWRGTTFRVWTDEGVVMTKGTALTLIAWAVLLAVRIPIALAGHAAHYPQGLVIGELLLSLAATFGAQNAVIWIRASRLTIRADPL